MTSYYLRREALELLKNTEGEIFMIRKVPFNRGQIERGIEDFSIVLEHLGYGVSSWVVVEVLTCGRCGAEGNAESEQFLPGPVCPVCWLKELGDETNRRKVRGSMFP